MTTGGRVETSGAARPAPPSRRAPVRLLHLVHHPIQYFAPLYRELAGRPEVELTVAFLSDDGLRAYRDPGFGREVCWDVPIVAGYRHRFLSGPRPARSLAAVGEVLRGRHDVAWIHGYSSVGAWMLAASCVAGRVPVLIRDEATLLDRRSPWKRAVKAAVLPALFRFVHGLCIGTENRRYFERYGIRGERLLPARYSVDNGFFASQAEALAGERAAIRRSFGLPHDQPVVLFCGKLIPKKDPLLLLAAFAEVRRHVPCSLLFAGDGELRPAIEESVRRAEIPDVSVTGFLNQTDLPRAYAAADLAVLPSAARETWGLAVNEAMNFGLPIVVSDRVGCAADLVVDGENGTVVPSGSLAALACALRSLVTDPARRRRWGERSRAIVGSYDVRDTADDIVSAVLQVARG